MAFNAEVYRDDGTNFECDNVRYIPFLDRGEYDLNDCPICLKDCKYCEEQCR
jgi:hypothetical protein